MTQAVRLITLTLAVLLSADVMAQDPVPIQFQVDPVLVQTGTEIVFTVLTVPEVLSMSWEYQGGVTLGLWAGGAPVVNPVSQFQGRVTIRATQLLVGGAQLRDTGDYTVTVTPLATTGLTRNSRSIKLTVFDAVSGVSLAVPSVALEGKNISLSCTWTAGTEITVIWGKEGATITPDSRISVTGGSLVISPARRGDAGDYTCTVSNLVSAGTATESLTVYYGPDTPVLTKEAPKECVGDGDVLVGQTARLTCISDSLPPALFSWQRDGQAVATGQPDSGVLSLQTLSTDESGRYVCTATNSITAGSSLQGTDLSVVDVCLDGGEVAGIVIGIALLILIIALLIVLIVFLARRRREQRQRDTVFVQKSNPDPRPIPPDPQTNGARDLGQGPVPPLYHVNVRQPGRLYSEPRETHGDRQMLLLNTLPDSDAHPRHGPTRTNGNLHSAIRSNNSYPHNGVDNPAFARSDAGNANAQQRNSNVLIQAGTSQGGNPPPAVHVSLNAQPHAGQGNTNGAQMPTIHVNLNSFPANGQQTQQGGSFPLNNTLNNNALQHQSQTTPTMQSGPAYPSDPRPDGQIDAGHQAQRGLVPTGYTHFNGNNVAQQNADTQTYEQVPPRRRRSERNWERADDTPSSARRQMPWDRLRGTPSYADGPPRRERLPPDITSDTTDYTAHAPIPEARPEARSRPRSPSHGSLLSRVLTTQDALSSVERSRSRSAERRSPSARSVVQFEDSRHTRTRSPRSQRESDERDIAELSRSQPAPRQEAAHSSSNNNHDPQALPHVSQQASAGRPAASRGPSAQQGGQGADLRALADPNHLPQTHVSQQHRAAPVQNPPPGPGTQPATRAANHPGQADRPAQPHPSTLTQAALRAHTQRVQPFQNRKQQTQAALLSPGPQPRAPGAPRAPTPPPVMAIEQFQTLPKERTQHRSPARGPQPPRPPVNIPVSQRNLQVQHRPNAQRHPANMPATHHQHPGNGQAHAHRHAHAHAHAKGHGHPAHFTAPRQQQAHRGRPR